MPCPIAYFQRPHKTSDILLDQLFIRLRKDGRLKPYEVNISGRRYLKNLREEKVIYNLRIRLMNRPSKEELDICDRDYCSYFGTLYPLTTLSSSSNGID